MPGLRSVEPFQHPEPSNAAVFRLPRVRRLRADCHSAGFPGNTFKVADDEQEVRAKLSHAIHQMSREGKRARLSDELVRAILQGTLPTLSEQLDNLITWIGNQGRPGAHVDVEPSAVPAIGAIDAVGFAFVADQAQRPDWSTAPFRSARRAIECR